MDSLVAGCFFVFGAVIASFSNVVIYRWPKGMSVVKPRSTCPHCNKLIPFYLNIPILGWIALRGKTACCKNKLSPAYLIIELVGGLSFLITYWKFGLSWVAIEYCIFMAMALPCFVIDLKHYLLPDVYTIPGTAIGILGSFLVPTRSPLEAALGALVGGGVFWLTAWGYKTWRKKEGMGLGDVKLLAWLGALGGLGAVWSIIFISCFLGSIVGFWLILTKKGGRDTAIPFGPFLIVAALIVFFYPGISKFGVLGLFPF